MKKQNNPIPAHSQRGKIHIITIVVGADLCVRICVVFCNLVILMAPTKRSEMNVNK